MKLVLASTSPYRRSLLDRLDIRYICDAPDIDESPLGDEAIEDMVVRLAVLKARAVADRHAHALVIGSDQSASLDGRALNKPGNFDNAVAQLSRASGRRIVFHTGLCVLNTASGRVQTACEPYAVVFRELSAEKIEHYVEKEQPYNCAGSFRSEGLGITLFEKFEGEDPNALIGLPLIRLVGFLENEGFDVLKQD